MYKASRFNSYVEEPNGDLKVINSFSGKMVLIPKRSKALFVQEISDGASYGTSYLENLNRYGLIVPRDLNEIDIADIVYQDFVTQNKLTLVVIPVFDCNLRCKYCYEYLNGKKITTEIMDRIEKFVKYSLYDKRSLAVVWFGGEPLQAFGEMVEMMERLRRICQHAGKVLTQGIITNGHGLDAVIVDTLIRNRCTHMTVTLDGTERIHDIYRPLKDGGGSFAHIVSNLRYIRDNVKSKYLSITLRSNITVDLASNISGFVEFLEKEFSDDSRFQFLWRFASDWGGSVVAGVRDQLGDEQLLQTCFESIQNSRLNGKAHMRLFRKCGYVCDAAKKNHFVIGPDASVFKCTMKLYSPDEGVNRVGVIDENGIVAIDQRKDALWRVRHKADKCNSCSFYAACLGMNCPAQRVFQSGNECPYDKAIFKQIVNVLSNSNDAFIRVDPE